MEQNCFGSIREAVISVGSLLTHLGVDGVTKSIWFNSIPVGNGVMMRLKMIEVIVGVKQTEEIHKILKTTM
jgi:hypothetical protein